MSSENAEPSAPKLGIFGKLLWLIGIVRTGQTQKTFRLEMRFYGLIALIVIGIGSFVGLLAYSTAPSFCRSCHIMEPYYQAWANSQHKSVACVDCHYPPGSPQTILWKKFQALSQVAKFVTRTYSSKPFAEVEDASCLRSGCHSLRLLQGKVITEKNVIFNHRPHLEGVRKDRQLMCVSCHSQIVVGKHMEVTYDTCYLCHFKGQQKGRELNPLAGCTACHILPDKEFKVGNITYNHKTFLGSHQVECQSCHQDVIQGTGEVGKDKCQTCHNEPEKLKKFDDMAFLHENHVTKHNTACFHCHEIIKHAVVKAGHKKLSYDCGVCHLEMHGIQKDLYRGVGAKGVNPMPSPMYLSNVDCIGCHTNGKGLDNGYGKSKTFTGGEEGCIKCHDESYKGTLVGIHELVLNSLSKMQNTVATLTNAIKDPTASQTAELNDIAHNLYFVQKGHSVHNVYYSSQILRLAYEKLTSIASEHKIEIVDLSDQPVISGGFCATLCHDKVGVKVPADTKSFNGKVMPHKHHMDLGLSCTDCHTFGNHKDVKLKQPTKCSECHEE